MFLCIHGLPAAGLRRSFRLSRKDRQGSSGECSELGETDFLTYEEVTRYQQRPNERPRLVVLIGKTEPLNPEAILIKLKYHSYVMSFTKVLLEPESMN